ncbi:MAG: hypothetical protein HOV66_00120 [Streptomycetaceae bacterium]|nr:hypothetical protein [Streptomycetaceae bacterium]NUS53258.1 hypothetical protein [Streptomycetaceae bacterium]
MSAEIPSTPGGAPAPRTSIGQWIARIVAIVVLIPLRLLWEGVKLVCRILLAALVLFWLRLMRPVGRFLHRWVLRPLWIVLKDFLWGRLLQHLLWGLILTPIVAFVVDWILKPVRKAVEEFLWRRVLVPAGRWLWRRALKPIAKVVLCVVVFVLNWCVVWPLRLLWRWILHPLWRALKATLRYGWRVATAIVRVTVVIPCRALYRTVLRPVLHALGVVWRYAVARPARRLNTRVLRPMNRFAADIWSGILGR